MADLVEFLRARLDEDEEAARRAAFGWGSEWTTCDRGEDGAYLTAEGSARAAWSEDHDIIRHAARWDPARVLAEVAAKRAVVAYFASDMHYCDDCGTSPLDVLTPLAQPYADHPDFDPTWSTEVPARG